MHKIAMSLERSNEFRKLEPLKALHSCECKQSMDSAASTDRRLAGAPISWGVCEIPGWGRTLGADRVLGEMAALGLGATELGAIGFLPLDPSELRSLLGRYGLDLVAGFAPLVLHRGRVEGAAAAMDGTPADLDRVTATLAATGARFVVAAPVVDAAWSPPIELDRDGWSRLITGLEAAAVQVADHGMELLVHPHAGTLIESATSIDRVLAAGEVRICFDTGHWVIAGADPVEFVNRHGDRIAHVHLKDVDASLATAVREHELALVEATRRGLFRPLGDGDAEIAEVVRALDAAGYRGWLVLEQDTAIAGDEPPPGEGPAADVRRSIEFLQALASGRDVLEAADGGHLAASGGPYTRGEER
jgi:inosose dehydratase